MCKSSNLGQDNFHIRSKKELVISYHKGPLRNYRIYSDVTDSSVALWFYSSFVLYDALRVMVCLLCSAE